MNKEVKSKWVAALRSGEFKQGKHRLRTPDGEKHCCLGVLCELHSQAHGGTGWEETSYLGTVSILPRQVQEWAGIAGPSIRIGDGISAIDANDLLNLSFPQIANLIETTPHES